MKLFKYSTCLAAVVLLMSFGEVRAQQSANCGPNCGGGSCVPVGDCSPRPGVPCPTACNGVGPEGYCIGCGPLGGRGLGPRGVASAARDHYSPHRVYAYSRKGADATRFHRWNWQQSATYPWHGNYNYWAYNQPTAMVVPPTAAFQSEYNWGVAQTRSIPIYHQYSRNHVPATEWVEGADGLGTSPRPFWPTSTNQFGIYPVRGPW